jgi:hypothetical protein
MNLNYRILLEMMIRKRIRETLKKIKLIIKRPLIKELEGLKKILQ